MKIFIRVLFFAYILIVFLLSVYPYPEKIIKADISDKIQHMMAFAVYIFLFYFSFSRVSKLSAFVSGIIFGIIIELAQVYSPNRDPSFLDVVADIAGLIMGYLLIVFFTKLKIYF